MSIVFYAQVSNSGEDNYDDSYFCTSRLEDTMLEKDLSNLEEWAQYQEDFKNVEMKLHLDRYYKDKIQIGKTYKVTIEEVEDV